MYENKTPKRVLVMGLMLGLGIGAKTLWDEVSLPAPAAFQAPVELAPLPSPPQPAPKKRTPVKAKAVRTGRRAASPVAAPAPAPAVEEVVAPAPAPAKAPEAQPEPELSAPPLLGSPSEEPLVLTGGNGAEIARAIANAKRRDVQACFERELKRSPKLEGRVTVQLELAPPQKIESVRVSDDLGSPDLTRCIDATMHELAFTGLDEEISIEVPYQLSARRK